MDINTLREQFANDIVDGMDLDALMNFAFEKILENLEDMPDGELMEQVKEFAPYLIDNEVTK